VRTCVFVVVISCEFHVLRLASSFCFVFSSAASLQPAELTVSVTDVWLSGCLHVCCLNFFQIATPVTVLVPILTKLCRHDLYANTQKLTEQVFKILILIFFGIFEILHLD